MCVCKGCCVRVEGETGKCKGRDVCVCVCVQGETVLCVCTEGEMKGFGGEKGEWGYVCRDGVAVWRK